MSLLQKSCLVFAALCCGVASSWSQPMTGGLGPVSFGGFGDQPVEITAEGETRFEGGVAVAEDNVQIHYGDASIYADYAEYNPDTRDVFLDGNVRIYTPEGAFVGQRAVYNLETKQTRALEFGGEFFPLRFRATSLRAPSMREFRVAGATLTTDDSSEPDFYVRARTMRIYPDDRVIFVNSTVFVKDVPVLWFPYLYSNLSTTGFTFLPGYDSQWGAYLLTSYAFPIGSGNDLIGKVRVDYRTERGFALGFDADIAFGPDDRNTGTFEAYHAWDQDPSQGPTGERPPSITPEENRYRVAYKQTLFLADDLFAKADINVLSDRFVLEDFFPNVFRLDPEPDNYISLTKWADFYTINLLTRWQVNDFQQYTQRLPELVMDIKRHQLFGWPVSYSGETGVAQLNRAFADDSPFPDYDTLRFDTFHELSAPFQLFGWWSVVPAAGFRLTYYDKSGTFESTPFFPAINEPLAVQSSPLNTPTPDLNNKGAIFRPIFHFNLEQSFKLSKAYERIQARWLGLDGVRHIVQPYTNLSLVFNAGASPDGHPAIRPRGALDAVTSSEFPAVHRCGYD
jgi:LPS-assembly protein